MGRLVVLLLMAPLAWGAVGAAELPRSSPEAQGVSSHAILAFVDALDKIDQIHSFMLVRHGQVLAAGWWDPYGPGDPHMLYSLSKSFTSTAVGLAIAEGKLSLDDRVLSFFPEQAPDEPSENLKSMRVRDLLAMNTGHHAEAANSITWDPRESQIKAFLALPVAHRPGTHFVYNTPATYMCSAIVQKATGEKVVDYLRPRLFEPLGIEKPNWTESGEGVSHGGFGLSITTEDIAKFGQLDLQRGAWEGEQVVPAEWVAAATSRQTSNGSNPDSDWEQGYGYQFWRCRHGCYRGDGAFGQFCVVMPEQDAVLAITSGVSDMQKVLQTTWDVLLPAFQSAALAEDAAAQQKLEERVRSLRVPAAVGEATSSRAAEVLGKTYKFAGNEAGLQTLTFEQQGDHISMVVRAKATLIEGRESESTDVEYAIDLPNREWKQVRVPTLAGIDPNSFAKDIAVAATAAWTDADTLAVKLVCYETPYYLSLAFRFSGDDDDVVTVDSRYNVSFGDPKLPQLVGRRQ
jgi:CubicO group peptidase (beta-lactamase class C family)